MNDRFAVPLLCALALVACSSAAPSTDDTPARATVALCPPAAAGHARCDGFAAAGPGGVLFDDPITGARGLGAADLADAYRIPTYLATNATIAIVTPYDYPNAESDLAVYRAHYGLAPCASASGCFGKIGTFGDPATLPPIAPPSSSWPLVAAAGLAMASAGCPSCKLILVEASSTQYSDLMVGVGTAVTFGANAIAVPWGFSEALSDGSSPIAFYDKFLAGLHGASLFAAAGDAPSGVTYPSSSPYAIAVGGTSLQRTAVTPNATVQRGWTEGAYANSVAGCSALEPKPSWQTDSACASRTVADISVVADPSPGVAVYSTSATGGGWASLGGTIVSAPLAAGIFALTGNAAAGPSFAYSHASAFHDVGVAGYDAKTGMGTPNGYAMNAVSANDAQRIGVGQAYADELVTTTSFTLPAGGTVRVPIAMRYMMSAPSLTMTGLPDGVTASFVVSSQYSSLYETELVEYTLTAAPTARLVQRTVTIQATASNGTFATTVELSVVPPPSCVPTTCGQALACFTTMSDGCGGTVTCGACAGGVACNAGSCCPAGRHASSGACVCDAQAWCPSGSTFDTSLCGCVAGSRPDPCVKTHSCY